MNNTILRCLVAGALATILALASPAFARGGGFGGGGGGHGGGGMHGGGMHIGGGHFGGGHFAGRHFAGGHFAHAGFAPHFSRFGAHHAFFRHHRFHRFGFVGVGYAAYDGCWRRVWTPYGLQWVDACSAYGYY